MDETDVDDVVVALVNFAKRVYNSFPFVFVSYLSFFPKQLLIILIRLHSPLFFM